MFTKKINCSLVFVVILLLILVLILACVLSFGLKKQPHEILTKKFEIPIKEEYEIVYFENQKVSGFEKRYKAKLKISENEYHIFLSELKKAGYSIQSSNNCDPELEDFSDWIDGEKLVKVYSKAIVEPYLLINGNRIHLDISITETINGNYHVYMSR